MKDQNKTSEELKNEALRTSRDSITRLALSSHKLLSKKSHILFVAAIVIAILSTGGYLYYSYSAGQLRTEKENELKAIAELKTDQLVRWHKERVADIKVISESPFFGKGIEGWLENKNNKPLRADILERLQSAITNFGYQDIFLVSNKGDILLSNIQSEKQSETHILPFINEASVKGELFFTDFYYCPLHRTIHYDIIAPVKNESKRIIANLVFRLDPYDFLYPLIQSWPLPSKTAEVLLVKNDGNSVLFLNDLRHQKNTALQLRIPLTRTGQPAVQAVLGKTGFSDGKDYRGVEVVAYLSTVPGTNWSMVSKVDKDEIFADLFSRGIIVFIVIFLLILTLTIGMAWIYQFRQRDIFRNLWQVQEEYRTTLYSIGDAVVSTNVKGHIKAMNEAAENLTGWKEAEAIGKKSSLVFNIINEETHAAVENPVNKVLKDGQIAGLANHTLLIAKNGTAIPIASSGAPIKNEEGKVIGVVLVFRDQTEEKLQQDILKARLTLIEFSELNSLNALFTKTLDEAELLTKSKIGFYHFMLPDQEILHMQAWSTATEKEFCKAEGKGLHYKVSEAGAWADCVHQKKPVIHNDYASLPDKKGMPGGHVLLIRELLVPVLRNNKIVAVLGVGNKPTDYTQKDIEIVSFIADVLWEITEKKIKEDEKAESDRKFHSMINNLNGAVYRCAYDPDWTMEYISNSAFALSGYPASDFINNSIRTWESIIYPDDKLIIRNEIQIALGQKLPYTLEFRIISATGEIKWVWERGRGVFEGDILIALEGYISGITERKRAENALKRQNEIFTTLLDNLSSGVFMVEVPGGKPIISNPKAIQLLGHGILPEAAGNNLSEVYNAHKPGSTDPYPVEEMPIIRGMQGEVSYIDDMVVERPDGTRTILEISGAPVRDDKGEIWASLVNFQDITARKQAETMLKDEKQRIKTILELIGDPIFLKDNDHRITYANSAFFDLFGLDESSVIGKTLVENIPKHEMEHFFKIDRNVLDTGIPDSREEKLTIAGHTYTIITRKARFIDESGNKFLVGSIHDISDRKQAEEALLKSQENLSITLNSIGDGVISTDINGLIVNINPIAEKFCGWPLADAIGKPLTRVFRIINSDTRETVADPVQKVLEKGEIVGLANHTILISKNGSEYQISDSAAPIKNKEGVIVGVVLVFSDVTQKYAAELAVINSERAYSTLVGNLPGMTCRQAFDSKLTTHFISEPCLAITGYHPEDFIGNKTIAYKDIIVEEYQQLVLEKWNEVLPQKLPFTLEYPIRKANGEIRWVWERGQGIYDNNGNVLYLEGYIEDITESKQVREALKESEAIFRNLHEKMLDGIYKTTHDGKVVDVNPAMLKILGYSSKQELVGVDIGKELYFDPADREKMTIEGLNRELILYRLRKKDGTAVWVEDKGWYTYNESGEIIFHEGVIRDISDRIKHEAQIRTLGKAIEQSPVSIIITNAEGNIEFVNNEFVASTQYTLTEVIGKKPRIFNPGHLPQNVFEAMREKLNKGYPWKGEFFNRKKNGTQYYEEVTISSIQNPDGSITNHILIMEDITEKKKNLDDLILAKEKAQESDRLKSAFLANMSHEIRTPMNGILGFAGLLKEPELSGKEQQEYIKYIEVGGRRMLNIINDIVDISKIEAGLMNVNFKDTNINEKTEFIYSFFKPQVEEKGLYLLLKNTLPAKETTIRTDSEKFYSILTNLVKNAIKYTEKGSIEFGYEIVGLRHALSLQFYVKDTGIGIPTNRQEAVFERFIQADSGHNRAYEGAGLGLAITKAYVEMLGGNIWVESEEGVGSTFYFTLPYNPVSKQTTGIESVLYSKKTNSFVEPGLSGLKILIAEDDETSEILLSINVKKISSEMIKARTGFEAIEACRNNPDLDLILMDIQMPDINGYDATRQIREFNKKVVIIAQTAFGLTGDREKALEAGCNDYIAKPINKDELLLLIQKYFNH